MNLVRRIAGAITKHTHTGRKKLSYRRIPSHFPPKTMTVDRMTVILPLIMVGVASIILICAMSLCLWDTRDRCQLWASTTILSHTSIGKTASRNQGEDHTTRHNDRPTMHHQADRNREREQPQNDIPQILLPEIHLNDLDQTHPSSSSSPEEGRFQTVSSRHDPILWWRRRTSLQDSTVLNNNELSEDTNRPNFNDEQHGYDKTGTWTFPNVINNNNNNDDNNNQTNLSEYSSDVSLGTFLQGIHSRPNSPATSTIDQDDVYTTAMKTSMELEREDDDDDFSNIVIVDTDRQSIDFRSDSNYSSSTSSSSSRRSMETSMVQYSTVNESRDEEEGYPCYRFNISSPRMSLSSMEDDRYDDVTGTTTTTTMTSSHVPMMLLSDFVPPPILDDHLLSSGVISESVAAASLRRHDHDEDGSRYDDDDSILVVQDVEMVDGSDTIDDSIETIRFIQEELSFERMSYFASDVGQLVGSPTPDPRKTPLRRQSTLDREEEEQGVIPVPPPGPSSIQELTSVVSSPSSSSSSSIDERNCGYL